MKFSDLNEKLLKEDSQHSGYPTTLETPRPLGDLDYKLVALNANQNIGDELILHDGKKLKGSKILQNSESMLQYSHSEESEIHIESIEMYRDLWNSIHIPKQSGKLIGN